MFSTALVTGATGLLGRHVVDQLRTHARSVRIGARELSRVAGFPRMGFDVAYFDYDIPASWEGALAGVGRLLLVPPPVDPFVDQRLEPFVQRAVALGVRRIVLVSHLDAPEESAATALEHAVARHAPEWSIVRPTWFVDNVLPSGFLHPGIAAGRLVAPTGEGRVAWVAAVDVAAVAVKLLTDPRCTARVVEAVGPQGLSFRALAAAVSVARGTDVRFIDVSPDVFSARLSGPRWPARRVALLCERLARVRRGEAEVAGGAMAELLRRAPRSMGEVLRDG